MEITSRIDPRSNPTNPDDRSIAGIEPTGPALLGELKQLQEVSKQIALACKAVESAQPGAADALERALTLAERFDWAKVVDSLREGTAAARRRFQEEMASRREMLHHLAKDAGLSTEMLTNLDRIGIFTVAYDGIMATVSLGGVRIGIHKETDGRKLFEAVQKDRAALDAVPFHREEFFQELTTAMDYCRSFGAMADGFVPVRDLHREMVLDRARRSERFRRAPEAKNMEPYPLYQLVYDLARFGLHGWSCGNQRLATQAPSMRESKDTIFIPSLEHSPGGETAAARLAVRPL